MPAKILVVDDDKGILDLIKKHLARSGFSVVATDDGSEALLLLRESQRTRIGVIRDFRGRRRSPCHRLHPTDRRRR